jgi:hypothetical protein
VGTSQSLPVRNVPLTSQQCDLTGRVGSTPQTHSASFLLTRYASAMKPRLGPSLFPALRIILFLCLAAPGASAQRPDSARLQRPDSSRLRAGAPASRADTAKPPLSPRRAFLYSALLPGYSQSILGRNKAAAAMLTVEAMAIAMLRESAADVREARRMSGDTVVVSYVDPSGGPLTDPQRVPRRFDTPYVHVRQSHVEDWIAFIVANHLFSGADAFVAANLWDISTQLSIRVTPDRASVGASLAW